MTQQQAESVKDLAKDTVEALGYISDYACEHCGACQGEDEPKRWKWEPKVGEFCILIDSEKAHLISAISRRTHGITVCGKESDWHPTDTIIPILHWEEIERVLEGVGYSLFVSGPNPLGSKYVATIGKYPASVKEDVKCCAKSRQEAAMRAVIKLGKLSRCLRKGGKNKLSLLR